MGLLDKLQGKSKDLPDGTPELLALVDTYRLNFGEPMELQVDGFVRKQRIGPASQAEIDVDYYKLSRTQHTEFRHASGGVWNVKTRLDFDLPCNANQAVKAGDRVMLLVIPIEGEEDVLSED